LVPQGLGAVPLVPELKLLLFGKMLSMIFGQAFPFVPERSYGTGNLVHIRKAFPRGSSS
jgi:hypothetical protein